MVTMKVGTTITADYIGLAQKCLESLPRCGADAFCVAYGFRRTPGLIGKFPALDWYHLPAGQPGDSEGCVQYGAWTRAVPFDDDELVVMADADSVFQRPLDEDERAILESLGADQAGMTFNAGPEDTLGQEAERLRRIRPADPAEPDDILDLFYPGFARLPCYNGGLIAARMSLWRRSREAFEAAYSCYASLFHGINACQILINWLLQRGIPEASVVLLPQTMHTHAHYALPPDCRVTVDPITVSLGHRPVWFAHHFGFPPRKRKQ